MVPLPPVKEQHCEIVKNLYLDTEEQDRFLDRGFYNKANDVIFKLE